MLGIILGVYNDLVLSFKKIKTYIIIIIAYSESTD